MDQLEADETDRYIVPALRRGLDILEMFSRGHQVVTVPQITRELGISRATAFRLVHTLEVAGYLERLPSAFAYRLGRQSLAISFEYLNSLDVVDVARPLLEQLRDTLGATAHLAVRHGTAMLYLLRAPSRHRLVSSLVVPVGTRYPVHAVSCGRALLFDVSDAELDELFRGFDFAAFAAPAPPSLTALKALLAKERRKGYVSCLSAFVQAKRSVAAPVRDHSGRSIAAINVSDSVSVIKDPDGPVKDEVLATAAAISVRLGYRPSPIGMHPFSASPQSARAVVESKPKPAGRRSVASTQSQA
jgi:DNA-binding IclR family transcriptional regulator